MPESSVPEEAPGGEAFAQAEEPAASAEAQQAGNGDPVLLGIVVNQKATNVAFADVVSEEIQASQDYGKYRFNIVRDIIDLLWLSQRGGCGVDEPPEAWVITPRVDISELPIVRQCRSIAADHGFPGFEGFAGDMGQEAPMDDENTWIHLIYERYLYAGERPDGQPISFKDKVVYLDPDDPDNAILALQDGEEPDIWDVYTWPGYGPWLMKEIDVLLRMHAQV